MPILCYRTYYLIAHCANWIKFINRQEEEGGGLSLIEIKEQKN